MYFVSSVPLLFICHETGEFAHYQGLPWRIRFKQSHNRTEIPNDRGKRKIIAFYGFFLVSCSIANKNNSTEVETRFVDFVVPFFFFFNPGQLCSVEAHNGSPLQRDILKYGENLPCFYSEESLVSVASQIKVFSFHTYAFLANKFSSGSETALLPKRMHEEE